MKVFAVVSWGDTLSSAGDMYVHGIFSTEEKAHEYIVHLRNNPDYKYNEIDMKVYELDERLN
jgi:hypothetical protein